jgi:trans-2,3-dihydro-3-hydroxyanthranilate isomerase
MSDELARRSVELNFLTVDVFTDRQFGGNPLAVVLNAQGLTTPQMQSIAAEFNLSETTFVLPPSKPSNTAQVRIFTPRAELPFAGHPNIGTAYAIAREGICYGSNISGQTMTFEEVAGLVPLQLTLTGGIVTGARLAAPQKLSVKDQIPAGAVAEACSLVAADIETRNHEPCIASCGVPLVIAEVSGREALAAARPDSTAFLRHFPRDHAAGVFLYALTPGNSIDIQSRMFAPLQGIPEDPATGGAIVALIGLLASLTPSRDESLAMRIGQGFDMGRPSIIDARAVKRAGEVVETSAGGECVLMMRGILDLKI